MNTFWKGNIIRKSWECFYVLYCEQDHNGEWWCPCVHFNLIFNSKKKKFVMRDSATVDDFKELLRILWNLE